MEAHYKKIVRGFTLVELMVVILMVAILAAVALAIYRTKLDAAKWSEGKAMMGTVATAIRVYHSEQGPTGPVPTALYAGSTGLGFNPGDLTGTYFVDGDFSFNVTSMAPLRFIVTATPSFVSLKPPSYQLDQSGSWTP